jgi:hypothetical protein
MTASSGTILTVTATVLAAFSSDVPATPSGVRAAELAGSFVTGAAGDDAGSGVGGGGARSGARSGAGAATVGAKRSPTLAIRFQATPATTSTAASPTNTASVARPGVRRRKSGTSSSLRRGASLAAVSVDATFAMGATFATGSMVASAAGSSLTSIAASSSATSGVNSAVTTGALGPSLAGNVEGRLAAARGTLLDGRGADITGGSDGVGVRVGDGLADAGGLDSAGFGGALADTGGRDSAGFGGTLADTGGRDSAGLGGTLADTGGRDSAGFGGALADSGGRDGVAFGGTLAGAESDIIGVGITLADVVDFATVLTGTGVLAAAFTGTLVDSGMSSQPASMSSSAGLAGFSVPRREPPSAPEAI